MSDDCDTAHFLFLRCSDIAARFEFSLRRVLVDITDADASVTDHRVSKLASR